MPNKFVIFFALAISSSCLAQSSNLKKEDPLETPALLLLRNGGYTIFDVSFNPFLVKGAMKIEKNGILFTPDTLFTRRAHKRIFRFNHLMKSFFIPYSEVRKLKQKLYVTTFVPMVHPTLVMKDGTRYRFTVTSKAFFQNLKAQLAKNNL